MTTGVCLWMGLVLSQLPPAGAGFSTPAMSKPALTPGQALQQCSYDQNAPVGETPFDDCYYGDDWRCRREKWGPRCRTRTTGDMYPHYPYFPENHGYYYNRPYNYTHVLEMQANVLPWGGDPRTPYSHAMFPSLYQRLQVAPPTHDTVNPRPSNRTARLPSLQSIVK